MMSEKTVHPYKKIKTELTNTACVLDRICVQAVLYSVFVVSLSLHYEFHLLAPSLSLSCLNLYLPRNPRSSKTVA